MNGQADTGRWEMYHQLPARPREWAPGLPYVARSSPEFTTHRTLCLHYVWIYQVCPTLLPCQPGPVSSLASRLHSISMRRCIGTSAQELRVTPSSLYGHHDYSAGQWPDICLAYCLGQTGASHLQVQSLPLVPSLTLPYFSSFPQLPTPTSSTLA